MILKNCHKGNCFQKIFGLLTAKGSWEMKKTKKNLKIGAYYPDRRQKTKYKTAKKPENILLYKGFRL